MVPNSRKIRCLCGGFVCVGGGGSVCEGVCVGGWVCAWVGVV